MLGGSLAPWDQAYWLGIYSAALPAAGLTSPRLDTLTAALSGVGGWWWPRANVAVLSDRPTVLARDPEGRLHCPSGPALAYADGYAQHYWHGLPVPADMVTGAGWDTGRILREENVEVRRAAIERLGWPQFVTAAGLSLVDRRPDPGNPGQDAVLYDVPEQVYGEPVRVVLVTNGSPEPDGTRRRFGLTVPAQISDAVAAAAWGYDDPDSPVRLTPDMYAALARRT